MIKHEQHARAHAEKHLKNAKVPIETLIVSVSGDVHANGDVNAVCTAYEQAGEKFYLLKGEREVQKQKKTAQTTE